jgi:hypothetical protein
MQDHSDQPVSEAAALRGTFEWMRQANVPCRIEPADDRREEYEYGDERRKADEVGD